MAEYDIVIKQGTIIDGLRTPRFVADVGIRDGRIAYIGKIPAASAGTVLDAEGLIVAPGVVDLHTHYDAQVFWDPYCTMSSWHGVTSVVIGNCGFGLAPVDPEARDRAMLTLSRNEAISLDSMREGLPTPWPWVSFPEFLDAIDATPKGVNMLSYVGLAPVMTYVMGLEAAKNRPATSEEKSEMAAILDEAIEAGACGWSTQWSGENGVQLDYDGTPMVTDTMAEEDLYVFAEVLGKRREGFIQLTGDGGYGPEEARRIQERIAEISGRPVLYNVLALGVDQHGQATSNHHEVMEWLDDVNARGHRIFGQAVTVPLGYEFTLEDWNLYDTSPIWREATLGTVDERATKLRDPERRQAMRAEYDAGQHRGAPFAGTIAQLTVEAVRERELEWSEGLTVAEIAEREQKHVVDAMLDVAGEKLDTTYVTPWQPIDMGEMKRLANSPFALPGTSDGGAHTKFLTMATYPTYYLATLARDHAVMDLEQAHWRLSAYPALAAGFKDRGWLREGAPADIIVYDLDELEILPREMVYDQPAGSWRRIQRSQGYRWVMVNGEITFEDGQCTGATPGTLLRHGAATPA